MRCADIEPTARYSPRDGPATVPLGLRSGLARGATFERRRNTIRVAKEASRKPIVLSRRTLGLLLLAALLALVLLVVLAPGVTFVASGGLVLTPVLSFPVRVLSEFMPEANAISQLPRREMTGPQPEGMSEEARG